MPAAMYEKVMCTPYLVSCMSQHIENINQSLEYHLKTTYKNNTINIYKVCSVIVNINRYQSLITV